MLDLKAIRHDASAVVAALAKRGVTFDLARFESLDARRKAADVRAQGLLAERKSASKKIGVLVAEGRSVEEAKSEVNEILSRLAEELASATQRPMQHKLISIRYCGKHLTCPIIVCLRAFLRLKTKR